MELDSIDKYIHMTKLAQGVEVMFAGQPCLKITEGMDSYSWAIYPVFAKLTYGASIFEDVPYCSENFETMEEAIADGLAKLHSLGAFVGEVDLPEDTYAESGVNESVEDLDESVAKFKQKVDQAYNSSASGNHKNAKMHLDNARSILFGLKSTETGKVADEYKTYKNLRKKYSELSEEILDSILQDCRAYAIKHSNSIMEAHDLSLGLYESILSEADFSGVNADVKRTGKTHEQLAAEHRQYAANMRRVGQAGLASRSEALAKSHDAAAKVNEETLDEGILGKLAGKIMGAAPETPKYKVGQTVSYQSSEPQPDWKDGGSGKGKITKYSNGHYTINGNPINHFEIKKLHEETLDEAKALSGDAYWKSKEDAASEAKAKADRASAGIKEPEKKGRGKPTLGATVDEMKDRMRENIAAGKRPHTGFDRNEKLRILRSGAMEHPEFAGTHVKAAGRPHGTTKAAAIEKKKAEPTAFSMWAGLGKK